jgi:precorrin-2 dehydrogenase/sirohydrochlorin ferrochelatase
VFYYPVFLNLRGKRVLVVGGGPVGVRKAAGLIEAGAIVTLVAPDLCRQLPLHWKKRRFRASDLNGQALAFAATNDRRVNARIASQAKQRGIPVNVADSPDECDFLVPARIRRGGFLLAISTGGENPRASAALRRKLEEIL